MHSCSISKAALLSCDLIEIAFTPVLQVVLGEGAQTVLEGQRVLPARAQEEGFSFQYSNVNAALKNIYKGA